MIATVPQQGVFEGLCNRCGHCCSTIKDGRVLVCQYLRGELDATLKPKPLGMPGATYCGVYEVRVRTLEQGKPFPIYMLDGERRNIVLQGECCMNDWAEEDRILAMGVGKGCSLTVRKKNVPLGVFIRTTSAGSPLTFLDGRKP